MMTFYNEPFIFLVKFRTLVLFLGSFIVIFLGMVFLLLIPCEFPEFLESVFLHLLSILEKFSKHKADRMRLVGKIISKHLLRRGMPWRRLRELKPGKGRKRSWRLLSLQTGSQPSLTIRIQRQATSNSEKQR